MTLSAVIVGAVIVWWLASVVVAVTFGRLVARADRDADLQQVAFNRLAASTHSHTAA